MSTITSHLQHKRPTLPRPFVMLGFAVLVLGLAILWRGTIGDTSPTLNVPVPAAIESAAPEYIARLQTRLHRNPDDVQAYAELGLGLLQQVRETGDISLYARAGQAFDEALARDSDYLDALVGQGILALALHNFTGALTLAERTHERNPWRAQILGIMVDAYVELGRYDEALVAAQEMVNLRPGLESYSRISYLRELHGDVDGAITAMQAAVDAGVRGTEQVLWSQVQLGHLYFGRGDLDGAEAVYRAALGARDGYAYAEAGLAQVQAARGEYAAALSAYESLTQRLPLPEFVAALGELYAATGAQAKAEQQYALVNIMQKLNADAGQDVDLDLAAFQVAHGDDPVAALELARAAYANRPTIYAADTLAWALYRNGAYEAAQDYSQEALRLGTQDALFYYHAGLIAQAQERPVEAESLLREALTINPYFDLLQVPIARRTLEELQTNFEMVRNEVYTFRPR